MSQRQAKRTVLRRCLLAAALFSIVLPTAVHAAEPPVVGQRPNVLFIFDDQLRADACGVYGGKNITTPHIDRLAEQGATFNLALSTCPVCTPYRGMLQTGRYPTHTGIVLNWVEVNPNQRTIAHVFREAGYRTGFIGKWHLAAGRRKHSGQHEVTREDRQRIQKAEADYVQRNPEPEFVPPGPARLGYDHWQAYNFHSDFKNAYYYEDTSQRLMMKGYETDAEADMAIAFMRDQQAAGKPFFLMVAPHPPHPPMRPGACPNGYLEKIPEELQWDPNVPPDDPHRKDPTATRCYYAMAKNFDDNVGRLMEFLDRSGLAANTIVVLTADHGEMMGSHGRKHKMVPYREATAIPCIYRWPGHIPAGRRLDTLQTPMDHYPTLCGLAGLEAQAGLDGLDLGPVILGNGGVSRDVVLMMNYVSNWDYFDTGTNWPEWRAVRTAQNTYVKWLDGKEELFDNVADPFQMKNIVAEQQNRAHVEYLRRRLTSLLADAHDEFLPGTAYADWYDAERNLVRTALGPVAK